MVSDSDVYKGIDVGTRFLELEEGLVLDGSNRREEVDFFLT